MKKNDNISICFRYHKQFKNGKHLYKDVELEYNISTEIASKEEFETLFLSSEIQTILYESTRELINAHNKEIKHDVYYIIEEIKDTMARTSLIEKDIQAYHQIELVKKALKTLTAKQQRRFYMYFIDGYSYHEIAEIENISYDTTQKAIQKSLQKIIKICGKQNR